MNEDEYLEKLESKYAAAVAKAKRWYRLHRCECCEHTRLCRQRPSGLITQPLVWSCRNCWAYANEWK